MFEIDTYVRFQKGGFFIESGALDGETRSNTLFLEKELGWKVWKLFKYVKRSMNIRRI